MIVIDWKPQPGEPRWFGTVSDCERDGESKGFGSSLIAVVGFANAPARFLLSVSANGSVIHVSEHTCLCEAQREAYGVINRSPTVARLAEELFK